MVCNSFISLHFLQGVDISVKQTSVLTDKLKIMPECFKLDFLFLDLLRAEDRDKIQVFQNKKTCWNWDNKSHWLY